MNTVLLLQGLGERNPSSRAIWVVSGVMFLALALMIVVELFDWVVTRVRQRASKHEDLSPDDRSIHGPVIKEPDSSLRKRHYRKLGSRFLDWW